MADPERMLIAAERAWQRDKPLIVFKMATGERGAAAAVSHTGSLAGSQAAYRAVFRRAGAILVDDYEALCDTAVFFAKAPPPKARGVAVVAAPAVPHHGCRPRRTVRRAAAAAVGRGRRPCCRAHPRVRFGAQSLRRDGADPGQSENC